MRKILRSILAVLCIAGVFAVGAPASAESVVPAGAKWDAGFRAYVVTFDDMSKFNPAATYKVPVVERYVPKAGVSAKFTACPTGTASNPNLGRFCAYDNTGFNGPTYMWNWQWKNQCVPVSGAWSNRADSFANGFPDQSVDLSSGLWCQISQGIGTIGPLGNDSDLAPNRNTLESFLSY